MVSKGPSGTPSKTEVSTSDKTSSSESDHSSKAINVMNRITWEKKESGSESVTETKEKELKSEMHEWYKIDGIVKFR